MKQHIASTTRPHTLRTLQIRRRQAQRARGGGWWGRPCRLCMSVCSLQACLHHCLHSCLHTPDLRLFPPAASGGSAVGVQRELRGRRGLCPLLRVRVGGNCSGSDGKVGNIPRASHRRGRGSLALRRPAVWWVGAGGGRAGCMLCGGVCVLRPPPCPPPCPTWAAVVPCGSVTRHRHGGGGCVVLRGRLSEALLCHGRLCDGCCDAGGRCAFPAANISIFPLLLLILLILLRGTKR